MTGARRTALAVAAAAVLYALFYFVLLDLPPIGVALFRIDYVMTTVARGNDLADVHFALFNARPVSQSWIALQSALGRVAFGGQVRYVTYAVQHLAILFYFFVVAHVLGAVFRKRLHVVAVLAAWVLFLQCQGVMEGVYKLESIVGTVSMLFGAACLWLLVHWDRTQARWAAIAAILAYAGSAFAKEDFLLPPVLLLAWFAVRDGIRASRGRWMPMAGAMATVVVAFVVFNRVILPGHSFIESIPDPTSPYYISTAPVDMLRTGWNYATQRGTQATFVYALWIATSLVALALRVRWKETLWIGLVVGALMGPYVILPNHQFVVYALKWLPWQVLGAMLLLQCIASERWQRERMATFASVAIALLVTAHTLAMLHLGKDLLYHQANSLRNGYATAKRLQDSLVRERDALNRQPEVAVLGVGLGRMLLSPWHDQGETDFWFEEDLGLRPRWVVYVPTPDASYPLGKRNHVEVRSIEDFVRDKPAAAFVVGRDGAGRLVDLRGRDLSTFIRAFDLMPPSQWFARPGLRMSATPASLPNCPDKREVVRVDWDLAAAGAPAQFDVWVIEEGHRTLWRTNGAQGSAATGPWGKAGLQVEFTRHGSGEALARLTVGELPCPK